MMSLDFFHSVERIRELQQISESFITAEAIQQQLDNGVMVKIEQGLYAQDGLTFSPALYCLTQISTFNTEMLDTLCYKTIAARLDSCPLFLHGTPSPTYTCFMELVSNVLHRVDDPAIFAPTIRHMWFCYKEGIEQPVALAALDYLMESCPEKVASTVSYQLLVDRLGEDRQADAILYNLISKIMREIGNMSSIFIEYGLFDKIEELDNFDCCLRGVLRICLIMVALEEHRHVVHFLFRAMSTPMTAGTMESIFNMLASIVCNDPHIVADLAHPHLIHMLLDDVTTVKLKIIEKILDHGESSTHNMYVTMFRDAGAAEVFRGLSGHAERVATKWFS